MRDADEGIVLTDREREALAGLADSIGDPWLARQLAGQEDPTPPQTHRRPGLAELGRSRALCPVGSGCSLTLAGAGLAVATFAASTVVASLGSGDDGGRAVAPGRRPG